MERLAGWWPRGLRLHCAAVLLRGSQAGVEEDVMGFEGEKGNL